MPFSSLPLVDQILIVITGGVATLVILAGTIFLIPELWRAGQETVDGWLEGEPDARDVRDADALDRLPTTRPLLGAASQLGSHPTRVRGLSEKVSGVGPVTAEARGNGRPSAAKGFKR